MKTLLLSTGRIIVVVILAFVILFVSFVVADLIPNAMVSSIIWAFVYSLMTFTVVYFLQIKLDKGCMKAIGTDLSQNLIKSITFGLGIGAATFGLILIAELAFGFIIPLDLFGDWKLPSDCIGLMIQGVISCLGIAIGEEVLYRGYLYGYLKKQYGLLVGIILSSIVFSAVHVPDGNRTLLQLGNIVVIGILLALITVYYKNIWAAVGFHWIWNLLEMYVFPISTDSSEKGVLRFIPASGQGIAGPENDILTTIVIIAVSAVFVIKIVDDKVFEHAPLVKKGAMSVVLIWILAFTGIIAIPKLLEETPYEIQTIEGYGLQLEELKLGTYITPSSNMAANQVMAPIAWTKSTGQNVTVLHAIVQDITTDQVPYVSHEVASSVLKGIAPDAELETLAINGRLCTKDGHTLQQVATSVNAHIVIFYQPLDLDRTVFLTTVKALIDEGYTVIIRRDVAIIEDAEDLFTKLSDAGALCVGDISPDGFIPDPIGTRSLADIYAPYGTDDQSVSSLISAGVAALVIEAAGFRESPHEVKDRLIKSGIRHYQIYDATTGEVHENLYRVSFQGVFQLIASFRKRPLEYVALNAPQAVGIGIPSDWMLHVLSIPDVWETSKGKGVKVAVLGSGFQLETPALQGHLGEGMCFHDLGYTEYPSYQGTVLSEIVCKIAPSTTILPILVDENSIDRVGSAIDWAVQEEADIILLGLPHGMNTQKIHSSLDHAVNAGIIVIWNSYKGENDGVLRAGYIGDNTGALSGLYEANPRIPVTALGERAHAAAQLAGIAAIMREFAPDLTSRQLHMLLEQTASQTDDQHFPNVSRAVHTLLRR